MVDLDGRQVRRVVVTWLMDARGSPLTVSDLVARFAARGLDLGGRPGKVVSDSLRWEVRRGRVRRLRRSTYVIGEVPRTTAYRIRIEARDALGRPHDDVPDAASLDRLERQALERFTSARRVDAG